MFRQSSCEIKEVKECDILYQVTYVRKCNHCDYKDTKERKFMNVLKSGHTMDTDGWHCPHCNALNITEIVVDKKQE